MNCCRPQLAAAQYIVPLPAEEAGNNIHCIDTSRNGRFYTLSAKHRYHNSPTTISASSDVYSKHQSAAVQDVVKVRKFSFL